MLKKDLISSPGLWRLAIELRSDCVGVRMTPLLPDMQPMEREVPLNRAISSPLAAFEELIYDNPLLLADFHSVEVLIDTPRYLLLPADGATDAVAQAAVDALWPDGAYRAVVLPIAPVDEAVVMAVDDGILSFVKRTYPDAPVRHPMEVMIAAVAGDDSADGDDAPDATRLVTELTGRQMSMVGMRGATLAIANVYPADNADDAVYYILAAAQAAAIDVRTAPVAIMGDADLRAEVADRLRRFAANITA